MATRSRHRAVSNQDVAALLQEYADLLAITGGDSFRVRAYERAARTVEGHGTDITGLDAKHLREIPGVGGSIAEKIEEFVRTGRVEAVEEARSHVPAGVRAMTAVPALGPRKAQLIFEELGVASIEDLAEAARAHRLQDLKGFGPKTEENILHGIQIMRASHGRAPLDAAQELAEDIVGALSRTTGCERCTYAGSLRRMRETVGDLDILVAAGTDEAAARASRALAEHPYTAEVIARGETKTSVRTTRGLQVDLRVVRPDSWGAALLYFTGSKAHNIRVRKVALQYGLKLSEYGLFDAETGRRTGARTEEEVYGRLGMTWIPPTLREDRGEVEAAMEDELPTLVAESDLRGDLHTHTDLTDGLAPLEDMVAAAKALGYEYYAITDHAPQLRMQAMTDEKILEQRHRVKRLDAELKRGGGPRLLHGTELNIDLYGDVDWTGDFLADFDLCVASVHSHFELGRAATTRRLLRACENPYVHVIGHPTARMLGKRSAIDADWDTVFAACARTETALEIDAQPHRLDLPDELVMRAKRHGVKFCVDSDAHSTPELAHMRYGVGTAQRGWLTPDDVINTWPLRRLRAFLRR
ncbi:DNA polymerase/3'-5' exonuclease PolX [Streptomyces sp. GC420]|uniref:DNA polymerase/3'-5' exonuclease PolX n=1 Tax=Streptomyces sp. GC420 TaxID=2697568 RepID=UPI001414E12B|nr:DNA polymerase/3'-5' exonuclease PolX [Streptomyces sp. GC420]NBM19802.1 DNA polymerase/3'-5' exonuclease PolX [Streptomyces sp. GC420]